MRNSPKKTYPTIEQLRTDIEKAKIIAMNNFERDWGTRDPKVVFEALRQTIPTSTDPADAARKARALLN